MEGESKTRETAVRVRRRGEEVLGSVSSGGVILETNQGLIHSWGLVGPALFLLGCLLAGSCPEECTGACLWKAEAMTSSSLPVAQSGNCLSLKKRGMEQECRKKPITLSFPPCSVMHLFFVVSDLFSIHLMLNCSSFSISCACVLVHFQFFDQNKRVGATFTSTRF